jgi:cytochrome c2
LDLRAALLILGLWFLAVPVTYALAGREHCLQCHKAHYSGMGSCTSCHRGDARSNRLAIAHRDLIRGRFSWWALPGSLPLNRGEKLLESCACRRCHTAGGKGNRLAVNLDRLPPDTTAQKIYHSVAAPALFMPDFRLGDRQLSYLVNVVLAGGAKAGRAGAETPQVVHFEKGTARKENVFEKKCGPCHKALTADFGAQGKGDIGPNLSGLFSEFYPATARVGEQANARWSADALKKWLENPRRLRGQTQMRPVPVKKEELDRIIALLSVRQPGK